MSFYLYLFLGLLGLLLLAFIWSQRKPAGRTITPLSVKLLEESGPRHVTYLPAIRQALAEADYDFILKNGSRLLLRRFKKERRRVALAYLAELRRDFQRLLEMARVIAVLSPEVAAVEEFERLRLTVRFRWRFEMIRMGLWAGLAPLPQLSGLGNVVSGLSVRIERAVKELVERAAMASALASSLHRRGTDSV
jgi:hypothetical protein